MTRIRISTPLFPPFGPGGEYAVWVDGVNLTRKVFTHKTFRRINNLWRAELKFLGLEDSEKVHVAKEKIVKIFANNEIILRGRIDYVEYDTDYSAIVKVKGMSSRLLKEEGIDAEYASTATETVFAALVPASSGLVLDPTDNGAFGDVTVSFDDENPLKGIKDLSFSIDYDWWEEWGTYPYDTPTIHIASSKGTSDSYTFNATGANANMVVSFKEIDTKYLVNSFILLGAGDGLGQKKTEYFYATDTRSTLASALTATATTVTLADASGFPSSGNVWIGCEKVTYAGKSGNNLTGCTRGVAFMGNVVSTENTKADTRGYAHDSGIAVYDAQYSKASPEGGVGMDVAVYGLHELSDTKPEIIDQNALDRMAQNLVDVQKDPVERIVLNPLDVFTVLDSVEVGDTVSVTDAASDLSGTYRVVGIISGFDEDEGEFVKLEVSNKKISFTDDMLRVQEETKKLGKYTQGITTIYAVHHAENCDDSKPLNLRFPIPAEVIGVSQIKLNFKIKPFRAYNDASQTATSSTGVGAAAADSDTNTDTISLNLNSLTGSDAGMALIFISEASDVTLQVRLYDDTQDDLIFIENVTFDTQESLFKIYLPVYWDSSGHTWTLSVDDMAGSNFNVDAIAIGGQPVKYTHSHAITMTFGIYEDTTPSGNVVVTCGAEGSEASVGTYDSDQDEVDITQQVKDAITVGSLSWLNVKFAPATENMRIEASLYIEVIVRR
jgi:hypothetical protein